MKKKILIVEDEIALLEAYELVLNSEGYEVKVAHDGEEALEVVQTYEPDLILLDLRMPRVNGVEFLKRYKPAQTHPSVKIIVFSNLDSDKEIQEAYALGAEKYVLKAWASPRELIKLVKDMLSSN
jgi:two-component system response regulator VicR